MFSMKNHLISKNKKAQTALEYMLLLTVVMTVVLVGFRAYLQDAQEASNILYNRIAPAILGEAPECGDGCCNEFENLDGGTRCPVDCPGPSCP